MRIGSPDVGKPPPAANDDGVPAGRGLAVDTSHLATPSALALLTAWDRWRGARLLPRRADMVLTDIAALLPLVVLLEVRGPDEVFIRLAGTALCAAFGQELTGQNWLNRAPPEARPLRAARLRHIVSQPCGALLHGTHRAASGMAFRVEQLALPIRPVEPTAPMQILGVVALIPGEPRPSRIPHSELGRLAEDYRFLDIGAGVPIEPPPV